MPMQRRTPDQLREKLYQNQWGKREFTFVQEQFGDELLFDALYGVFLDDSRPDSRYVDQEKAGRLLYRLDPRCHSGVPPPRKA